MTLTATTKRRIRDRLAELISLLRKYRLTGGLVPQVASNKMIVSRWGRGQQTITDEQLEALFVYVGAHLRASLPALIGTPKMWQEHVNSGNSLRDARLRAKLKQSEVAEALGVSRTTYIAAERTETGAVAERVRGYLATVRTEPTKK